METLQQILQIIVEIRSKQQYNKLVILYIKKINLTKGCKRGRWAPVALFTGERHTRTFFTVFFSHLSQKGAFHLIKKELKRLSRRELVDVIYQMKKNEQQMQEEMAILQESVQDKRIRIELAGSIAEAALDLSQVFTTAQNAADLYLREIACMKEDTAKQCAQMVEEAQQKVADILAEGQQAHQQLLREIQLLEQKKRALEGGGSDRGQ